MIKQILVIGGYGNFGRFISKTLSQEDNIQVTIVGRSIEKAQKLADELASGAKHPVKCAAIDIDKNFENCLKAFAPNIVIHTCGPFQSRDYNIAKSCINAGCHYIDLADARAFVENITSLDTLAKNRNVLILSGASSVPCLTSALIDHYKPYFKNLNEVHYAITTAQKTSRGLATTAAILGYTGKPFTTLINGTPKTIYGWQNLHTHTFKKLGKRFLGNCDIPDLGLFPKRYPDLKTLRFYAGIEIPFIHLTLWALSGMVRLGLIKHLEKLASPLLKIAGFFDVFGTANSAFYMKLLGTDKNDLPQKIVFDLTALSGDGPYIPCMPAILMAKKLSNGTIKERGATPCIGFISKTEYLDALSTMDIDWEEEIGRAD